MREKVIEAINNLSRFYSEEHQPGLITWNKMEAQLLWELSMILHDIKYCPDLLKKEELNTMLKRLGVRGYPKKEG